MERRSAAVLGDEGFDDFNDLLLLPLGQPGNGMESEPGPSARLRRAGRTHALAQEIVHADAQNFAITLGAAGKVIAIFVDHSVAAAITMALHGVKKARSSDSMALALQHQCPIFVARTVWDATADMTWALEQATGQADEAGPATT